MKIFTILTCFLVLSFSGFSQSENNEPFCKIIVHYTNTPPLLAYLFSKYGVEDSERITINIQNYELTNEVTVLEHSAYLEFISNINSQLEGQHEPEKINFLEAEKSKVVSILTIEALVTQ